MKYQQFIDYLFYKSHKTGAPMSGTFELTSRCNLDCKMCYIHKRANDRAAMERELSTEKWIEFARSAQSAGTLLLLLTGGEPLLRSDFREIYSACAELGMLISINTNGTLIDESIVEFWRKNPPLRVNMTLYGASRETYERLCQNGDAYDRAFNAVRLLKEAGIRLKLNFSAMPENIADLPKIYRFARENDLLLQVASYMFPPIRACELGGSECTHCRLSPETAGRVRWSYDEYRFDREGLRERAKAIIGSADISALDADNECQELPTERIRCRAGSTTFWLTCDGEMRPCGMMTHPSANALEGGSEGFLRAWKEIHSARDKIMLPAKCTACKNSKLCELCPAACYAENGSFTEVPEYLCRKLEGYVAAAREWLESDALRD